MISGKSKLSLTSCFVALALAGAGCKSPAEREAASIVEKNAKARGGLEGWREVKTISMSGKLDAGKTRDPVRLAQALMRTKDEVRAQARMALAHPEEFEGKLVQLPFVLEMERPGKTRLEIQFQGKTAVQVYDGKKGWKLRPFLGRHEVETFSAEELRLASQQAEIDGPLIDYKSKGNKVEAAGTEKVEGRDAYKLKITLKTGEVRYVWVDSQTFLDLKTDGSRKLDGKMRPVWTFYRDYKPVDGLMVPHLLETVVEGVKGSEKIIIEKVALNPKLDDARFGKPD